LINIFILNFFDCILYFFIFIIFSKLLILALGGMHVVLAVGDRWKDYKRRFSS